MIIDAYLMITDQRETSSSKLGTNLELAIAHQPIAFPEKQTAMADSSDNSDAPKELLYANCSHSGGLIAVAHLATYIAKKQMDFENEYKVHEWKTDQKMNEWIGYYMPNNTIYSKM